MSDPAAPPDPWETLRSLSMGQPVVVTRADGRVWRGTLVPSHEFSGDRIVQLKLESGYNIGVRIEPDDKVETIPFEPTPADPNGAQDHRGADGTGPWIALLTTGGTIASRIDYRTGGVRPVRSESEILSFYPDLERDGPVRVIPVLDRLSEEIVPDDWMTLADRIVETFSQGAQGVVVAHGTDTLAYSAAALAFLLEDLPGPVVVVGAQRSPDRPSSDGFSNLAQAARLARHPDLGEVVVLMHDGLSDDRFAIHRATHVRKMHSSRRDAFRSRNGGPIATVQGDVVTIHRPFRPRGAGPAKVSSRIDPNGAILWMHPGLAPERAEAFARGLRGLVIAGTGLGHASLVHRGWIERAIGSGTVVVMTTQCLEGNVDPFVYATGRELLRAGVLYAYDLLPETAHAKLLWALGRARDPSEVRRLMLEDRAGEFERRHAVEPPP